MAKKWTEMVVKWPFMSQFYFESDYSFAIVIRIFIKRYLKLFKNLVGYFSIQTPISNGVRELLGTSGVTHLHNRRPRSIHQDFATMFNLPPVSLEIHLSLQGGSQAGRAEHL